MPQLEVPITAAINTVLTNYMAPNGRITETIAVSFSDDNPDTINRAAGDFIDDGFTPGALNISGSVSNDGDYTIDTSGVAAGVLTLIGGDSLAVESAVECTLVLTENVESFAGTILTKVCSNVEDGFVIRSIL